MAQTGGGREREAAHKDPELTVNHEEVVCTGRMPRSRQWIASFANLPRILAIEISGEGAKQLDLVQTGEFSLHDETPRRSTHIVGLKPSVLVLKIYKLSS